MKSTGGYGAQRSQPYGGGGESYDGTSEFVNLAYSVISSSSYYCKQ